MNFGKVEYLNLLPLMDMYLGSAVSERNNHTPQLQRLKEKIPESNYLMMTSNE